jgi:rhodanese-related sulfurtransferase
MMVASTEAHPLEISLAEYLEARQGPAVQVIDVREQEEWDAGHLAEAMLVPLGELEQRRHELDPVAQAVIVCRSGRRSLVAADHLDQVGFSKARSLAGGMIAWVEAGQPIAR